MKISRLRLWADVGFTEGAIEVPAIGAALPEPILELNDVKVGKGRVFSELRLSVDYLDVYNVSYLEMVLEEDDLTARTFYGWVDEVGVSANTEFPMTPIYWHVDLWRTYIADAEVGAGIVQRREAGGQVPPQPYPFRYMTVSDIYTLESKAWWVYLVVVRTIASETSSISDTLRVCFPLSPVGYEVDVLGTLTKVPSYYEVMNGSWDEALGVDPKSVKAAFVCPYPPNVAAFTGNTVALQDWQGFQFRDGKKAVLMSKGSFKDFADIEVVLPNPMTSDDTTTWEVCGFDNELIGAIPWGIQVSTLTYRVVLGSSASYVQVRGIGQGGAVGYEDYPDAHVMGLCWSIPMVALEVTDNASSSYNYTGARQADIDQMVVNADKSRVSGLLNSSMSGMSGAIGGAMMGGGLGAAAGAAVGTVASIAGTEIGYRYETGEFLDRTIGIADYRAAHQTNGLLMTGAGSDSVVYGSPIRIRKLVTDDYSRTVRDNDIALYGAHVSEPNADCSGLVLAGGPLQIANAVVTGPIPNKARTYIRQRLASGVVIK